MKQLSVIIAAGSGRRRVQRCIRSLEAAGARESCEVIAVSSNLIGEPEWVRFLAAPKGASYCFARAAGLEAATTPLAAVLSEDYEVDAAWLQQALGSAGSDVTSGLVSPPSGLAAKAAWLWEYAHLAPPLPAGMLDRYGAAMIAAGNVVYRRERVDPQWLRESGSEMHYHRRMFDSGLSFARNPAMAAKYRPPRLGRFLRHRARWSSRWARDRAAGKSRLGRWTAAASRILLPPLVLARFAGRIARKPRYWLVCLAVMPLFVAFACAQAYGEARAYLEHG